MALADTGEVECKVVSLSERDRLQMQKDIAAHPNLKHIIGEFVYDSWVGYWKYMTLRTDKVKPNAMRVVFDTLEVKNMQNIFIFSIALIFILEHCGEYFKRRTDL